MAHEALRRLLTNSERFRSHEGRQPDDGRAVIEMDEVRAV